MRFRGQRVFQKGGKEGWKEGDVFAPPTASRRMRAKDYPFRRPLIPFVARCSRPKAFVNEYYLAPFEVKLRSSNVIVLSAICINRREPRNWRRGRGRKIWFSAWNLARAKLLPRREGRVSILEEFLRRFLVFEEEILWWNEILVTFEIGCYWDLGLGDFV